MLESVEWPVRHKVGGAQLSLKSTSPPGGPEIAIPDIARPDNTTTISQGWTSRDLFLGWGVKLYSLTHFSVRVDAQYKFMFAAGSIIWAAHRIKVFSSISFCFRNRTKNFNLLIHSNTETSLAMSTLAIWSRIVQSRDVRSRVLAAPFPPSED